MPESESDATEASLRGRLAVLSSWAQTEDRTARTAPGRAAMMAKFEKQVDPHGTLPPAERARRAEYARKAHYTRLSLKAVKARKQLAALRAAQERGEDIPPPETSQDRIARYDALAAGRDEMSS
jgi:hypothetical protein